MQVSHTYHFDFDHPVEKLWSVVADTVRWGEPPAELAPEQYRLRTLEAGGEVDLDRDGNGFPEIRVADDRVWLDEAATTGEITMSQAFSNDPAVESVLQDYPVRTRETCLKGIDSPTTIRQFSVAAPS